jgi:hypothetical protein
MRERARRVCGQLTRRLRAQGHQLAARSKAAHKNAGMSLLAMRGELQPEVTEAEEQQRKMSAQRKEEVSAVAGSAACAARRGMPPSALLPVSSCCCRQLTL